MNRNFSCNQKKIIGISCLHNKCIVALIFKIGEKGQSAPKSL